MLLHLGSCRGFKVWDTVDSRHDPHLDGVGIPTATEDLGVEGGRGRRDNNHFLPLPLGNECLCGFYRTFIKTFPLKVFNVQSYKCLYTGVTDVCIS